MRRTRRAIAVGVIAAGVAIAFATPQADAARVVFTSTVTPNTGVVNGTVLHDHGTGAKASTRYSCVLLVVNPVSGVYFAKKTTTKLVTSTSLGVVNCSQTFQSFSGVDTKGATRHCPLTTTDKNAGFKCGVALGDTATLGNASASLAVFKTA